MVVLCKFFWRVVVKFYRSFLFYGFVWTLKSAEDVLLLPCSFVCGPLNSAVEQFLATTTGAKGILVQI